MNLRWLWLDHVPESIRLSREERRRLRALFRSEFPLPIKTQFVAFVVGSPIVIGWFALYIWLARSFPIVFNCFTFWVGFWLSVTFVNHLFSRRHTYFGLTRIGYDVCIECGYWLRGLGDDVKHCPECGAKREPMPHLDATE